MEFFDTEQKTTRSFKPKTQTQRERKPLPVKPEVLEPVTLATNIGQVSDITDGNFHLCQFPPGYDLTNAEITIEDRVYIDNGSRLVLEGGLTLQSHNQLVSIDDSLVIHGDIKSRFSFVLE